MTSMTDCEWFYWSDKERNRDGKSLRECFAKYGTGGSSSDEMETGLLFLDGSRSDNYSWLLWIKHLGTGGYQMPARRYEEDPDTWYRVHAGRLKLPPPLRCAYCKAEDGDVAPRLLTCGGCQKAHYCSKDHQRKHWKQHKPECTKKCKK
jgi:hypothetical protein